jgi:AraC family transcriptional regulator, carnitine catabolism transcriptional activator
MQVSHSSAPCRTIGVLLFDRFSNHCLANAIEPLRAANTFAGRTLYRWSFLSLDGAQVTSSSGLPVQPDTTLARHPGGDYLFLMPSYGFRDHARPATSRALRSAARRFGALVGMDTGAWLLAAAGLLAGRRATIHWDELTAMAERFPDVEVTDIRFVRDGDRITCGGVTTAFDLVLAMIEAHHGPMLRLEVAALFQPGDRAGEGERVRPPTRRRAVDAAVAAMRRNIETPLPMRAIAEGAGVTQRALEAAFRETLDRTPQAVYRGLRLREARRLLGGTTMSVSEIAARCGYENASAMTRAFRAEFGARPRDVRRAAARA